MRCGAQWNAVSLCEKSRVPARPKGTLHIRAKWTNKGTLTERKYGGHFVLTAAGQKPLFEPPKSCLRLRSALPRDSNDYEFEIFNFDNHPLLDCRLCGTGRTIVRCLLLKLATDAYGGSEIPRKIELEEKLRGRLWPSPFSISPAQPSNK